MIVGPARIISDQILVKLVALNPLVHVIQFYNHQEFVAHVESLWFLLVIVKIVLDQNAHLIQDSLLVERASFVSLLLSNKTLLIILYVFKLLVQRANKLI